MVVFRRDPLTGRQMHQIYQLCSWGQNPKAKASTLKATGLDLRNQDQGYKFRGLGQLAKAKAEAKANWPKPRPTGQG